jgi:hypothetical protein
MSIPSAPFNTAKSLFAGLSVIVLKLVSTVTGVTAATTIVTKTAHGFLTGQAIRYISGTGFTSLVANSIYYVTKIDADTFSISATPTGSAISVGTSSAGIFQPVQIFECPKVDNKLEQEFKDISRPDSRGVLRKVRTVTTKEQESYDFVMDEAKRLLDIFGALAGRVTGYATIYAPDPDDASGKCALVSETDFACTVTRGGDMTFGDSDFTKPTIHIESNKAGAITWTADASI